MGFGLNEEQRLLRDQVRGLLADVATPKRLRDTITAKAPWDTELWKALADLGVLGAGIPEAFGGVGLGPVEVAIVAQELGRVVAPVPFFSSICLAAEALMIAGTPAQKAKWLPGLASGEVMGTLAWTEGRMAPSVKLIETKLADGRLNGRKSPVADVEGAAFCIVVALSEGRPTLALVELDQPGIAWTRLQSIDELRPYAEITFENAAAEPMDAADGAETLERILNRAAVYEAFEQVGGAEAALFMARDYTLQRSIFGRPLASYQAVKHGLANIFAKLELATCNALQAARALAENLPDAAAAAATARISATEVYETIARENLQYHGGIGFTWEANCHFHYRRARTLALNLGSTSFWADRLIRALETAPAEETRAAAPTRVVAPDTPDDAEYRARARAWLEANGPPLMAKFGAVEAQASGVGDETEAFVDLSKTWTRLKYEAGYSAIAHPKAHGGAGGTRRQQQIFAQEEARAKLAIPTGGAGFVTAMAAIVSHGTPEQRQKWERLTYSGQIYWCQLFSEPAAGSDLAGVRTRAVRQGDKWIVNGQKVWTSGGHLADYGILLARSDPDLPKHQGLSFFIVNMRQPGVTTRPIRQINGQSGFTETFFVDAEIPDEDRLDAVGRGWAVAMSVLAQERNTTDSDARGERKPSSTSARSLIRLAKEARRESGVALDDASVRLRIAHFHAEAQGIKNFTARLREELSRGGPPPLNLPVIKLTATNRLQQVHAFIMDLDEAGGIVGAPMDSAGHDRFADYMTSASARIAGGADEVLRNQLAERALGMPGDIRADKDVPFSQLGV
jgi:alkylation response protein AidB-like acyl-CoA dehydrogenase